VRPSRNGAAAAASGWSDPEGRDRIPHSDFRRVQLKSLPTGPSAALQVRVGSCLVLSGRSDSIRFDSIRFDSIRFDSIRSNRTANAQGIPDGIGAATQLPRRTPCRDGARVARRRCIAVPCRGTLVPLAGLRY
jgi:hypothetical protein